jgi:hypothetical protein
MPAPQRLTTACKAFSHLKMDIIDLFPSSEEAMFLGLSHDVRWNRLKDVIVQLYLGTYGAGGKSMTMTQVANFMRMHYSFHAASVPQSRRLVDSHCANCTLR